MAELFANNTIASSSIPWHKPVKWLRTDTWDIAFGIPPKCGSSSVRAAIVSLGKEYWPTPPTAVGRRVFVVRDPIKRFKSLWKNKCRDGGKIRNKKGKEDHPIAGMTPEELFEYIQEHANYHWTPQHLLLGRVEAEIVRIEDMPKWWAENIGEGEYPTTNITKGDIELSPELEEQLREYYGGDYDLIEGIR